MKLCSNLEQFNSSCASRYYCLHLLLIWFIHLCFTKTQMVIQYQLQSYQIDMLNVTMYIFKTLIKTFQINHLLKCCSYARMFEIKKIDISIFIPGFQCFRKRKRKNLYTARYFLVRIFKAAMSVQFPTKITASIWKK